MCGCPPLFPYAPAGEEALYEEDLGEEEVAQELAPVAAQLAYVAARWVLGAGRSRQLGLEAIGSSSAC